MQKSLHIALVATAMLLPTIANANADVVIMINGDRLTGEVKSLERGMGDLLVVEVERQGGKLRWIQLQERFQYRQTTAIQTTGTAHFDKQRIPVVRRWTDLALALVFLQDP